MAARGGYPGGPGGYAAGGYPAGAPRRQGGFVGSEHSIHSGDPDSEGEAMPGMGGVTGPMPSSKVATLANDIQELETKCNYLEQRNVWLTKRLLNSQKKFMERTLAGNSKVLVRRSFEGWREAMQELVLERQLDEQTASLDQCQQVAKELGSALAQEQEARRSSEQLHRQMRDDLQRAIQQEKKLKQQHKEQQIQLEILERRVHEAENCLVRSRSDAQAVIESANSYEKRRREMETEASDKEREKRKGPGAGNPLEYSIKLRQEAESTMQQVTSLLHQRGASPEREP